MSGLPWSISFLKSLKEFTYIGDENDKFSIFIGRSNVGKSSFINFLANNQKIAKISKKPGRTKLLNYYQIKTKYSIEYIIDTPGYGYAENEKKQLSYIGDEIIKIIKNNNFKQIIWIWDSRHLKNKNDNYIWELLKKTLSFKKVILILNKYDKLNQSEKHLVNIFFQKNNLLVKKIIMHSNKILKFYDKKQIITLF